MKNKLLSIDRSISTKWFVFLIILLGAVIRLWNLSSVPPSLTPDEAALGYNAYSILKTGKDEFGKWLPVIFKSFGDFKPGLYVYLVIPFVTIFGLTEFATRLPSVIAGILTVWLIYKIAYIWFDKRLAIICAFIAAFNPYLIYFARGAWEANVALTLTLAGIYFFLQSIYRQRYLIVSAVFFSLTLLTYQGAKLSTAIVVLLLILVYWQEVRSFKYKYLIRSMVFGLLIATPVILSLFSGQTQRLKIFSIFSYPRPVEELQIYSGELFNVFHSNHLNYVRMILSRWFNFYSGKFMFFSGDAEHPTYTPPYTGILLLADLVILPFGIYMLFRNRLQKKYLFIFLWLIFAPFSAAISRDQTNAVRSLNATAPLIIVLGLGLSQVIKLLDDKFGIRMTMGAISILYLLSLTYFVDAYFLHAPVHNSAFSAYGYKEAVNYIQGFKSSYNKIVFEQSFYQPYIYFLFYEKYDPAKFQLQSNQVASEYIGDVGYQTKLDNINFETIDWSALKSESNVLVVANPTKIPSEVFADSGNFKIIKEVKYLNGRDTAFYLIHVKGDLR